MAYRVYKGEHPGCVRLKEVVGHNNKKNDIIFHGPIGGPRPSRNVIFFPGDVQEYSEVMLAHRDNGRYVQWNLESTAELLSHRFPNSHIYVIKPATMNLKTFSAFSNFVESSPIGVPEHSENQASWLHLHALMNSAVKLIMDMSEQFNRAESRASTCYSELFTDSETDTEGGKTSYTLYPLNGKSTDGNSKTSSSVNEQSLGTERTQTESSGSIPCVKGSSTDDQSSTLTGSEEIGPALALPTAIIGFSKGCVPLNQLLFDKNEVDSDPEVSHFFSQIKDMYWLDGGHNGGSKTWINEDKILDKWTGSKIVFHAHVTPYQVEDSFRRWIGIEYRRFSEKLKKRSLTLKTKLHFKDEERSLENHFRVLQVF